MIISSGASACCNQQATSSNVAVHGILASSAQITPSQLLYWSSDVQCFLPVSLQVTYTTAQLHMMCQQQRLACAGALLLAVVLASPAAAARQLTGANLIKGGKGPRYTIFPVGPAVGAFTTQRTYFVPAQPIVAAQPQIIAAQPIVAAQPQIIQQAPHVIPQPMVVASQPQPYMASTVVATAPQVVQPSYVAAGPSYVAAGPISPKTDMNIKMNVGLEFAKSVQGNVLRHFKD